MCATLTGKQYEAFWLALCDAYKYNELERLVQFRLEKRLDRITTPGTFEDVVYALVGLAQREDWHLDLLRVEPKP